MGNFGLHSVLLLLVLEAASIAATKDLCPRIFFQNIDESKMPYKTMEDVYVKQANSHNGFPVYKGEQTGIFFFYRYYNSGGKYLTFGSKSDYSDYFGVAARVNSYSNPVTWLSSGTLNKQDVFNGLISGWQYWDYRQEYNVLSASNPFIKAVCVDEDFRECDSNKIYMTDTITDAQTHKTLNDPSSDYFSRTTGDFRNLRPVYYQSTAGWYLQYDSSTAYWFIGTSRWSSSTSNDVVLKVKDYALRPEFITNTWQIHNYAWKPAPLVQLRCRGIKHGSNGCTSGGSPCGSNSTCVYTSGNETVCVCNSGYTGPRCTDTKQCAVGTLLDGGSEIGGSEIAAGGRNPGSLMMLFCATSSPSVRFGICVDGSTSAKWVRQGSACIGVTTTPTWIPRTTPYYPPWRPKTTPYYPPWRPATTRYPWGGGGKNAQSKINFDDYPAVVPAVLTCAVILQVLLPAFIWFIAVCIKACKEVDEDREDETQQQEFTDNIQRRLEAVARARAESLDQNVRVYQDAVREHQRETDKKEKKRRKGLYRNAGCIRLYSMGMWFSFLMWLGFLIGCRATQCLQYGVIFYHLWLMSVIMCCIAPLIFLIESFMSHERSYITNIMEDEGAWDYISRMHEVAPILHMQVECYHWETRTRTVYYTDSNGNSQSRTETYQEKVVTFVDNDTFNYGSWKDVSKREMPELSRYSLTRLKIESSVGFGDQETTESYEEQKEEMMERNRHRDVYTDYSMNWEVPGLEKRISAYVDMRLRPFWIRERYYWLATLLCMTWPYRWFFRAKTAKNYYALKKKMYKSHTPPPDVDIMNPIALLQSTTGNPGFQGSSATVNEMIPLVHQPSAPYPPGPGSSAPYPPPTAHGSAPPYPTHAGPSPYPPPTVHGSAPPYPTPAGPACASPYPPPTEQASAPPYMPPQGAYPPTNAPYPPPQGPYPPSQCAVPMPDVPPPAYDDIEAQGHSSAPARC